MKVMVIVKGTSDYEAGALPSEKLLAEMGNFNEELVKAGIMLAGEGLHPSSKGVRVRFSGKNRTVIDGPFAETKELIAGFWMWRVKTMEEAIEWVRRCPNPHEEECEIEIRPVFESEDLGEAFTPELREQEASIRAQALGFEAPRFEDCRELLLAGLNQSYTFETRGNIPSQWNRFAPRIKSISTRVGDIAYGVCWNYKPGQGFDYLAAVEVHNNGDRSGDLSTLNLPARRYAIFTHRDHVSSITQTIDNIWKRWIPDCGLEIANAPCFERYTEQFNSATGLGGVEIWIPLGK